MRRQDLDRDRPIEPCIPRPIDLSHPPRAGRRQDLVRPKPSPFRKCHLDCREIVSSSPVPDRRRTPRQPGDSVSPQPRAVTYCPDSSSTCEVNVLPTRRLFLALACLTAATLA